MPPKKNTEKTLLKKSSMPTLMITLGVISANHVNKFPTS